MFTTHCFIRKNTPELRNKLLDMGYIQNIYDKNEYTWLAVNHNMFISVNEGFERLPEFNIDCGENIDLFLALAALRDDTDKHQWFVDDNTGIWERSENELPSRYMQMEGHKATVEEIIKHFT